MTRRTKRYWMLWRGSDPAPKDTWRYNVLENDEMVKNVQKM